MNGGRLALVRQHRWRISLTYGLALVELGFETLYPLATGVAIDGLLRGQPQTLALLVGIWLAHALVGVLRQVHDTRLFARLYTEAVTEMIDVHSEQGASTAALAGRAALARHLIDFLEQDVPALLTATLGLGGSLVLLAAYESRAGLLALLLLLPVGVLNWRYGQRAATVNAALNDAAERAVQAYDVTRRLDPGYPTHGPAPVT